MKGILGLNHVGIFTPDRDKSRDFYVKVLGFEHVFTVDNENNSNLYISVVRKDNLAIELLQPVEEDAQIIPSATASMNHMAIACKDLKEIIQKLSEYQIEFETKEDIYVEKFGNDQTDIDIIFFRGPSGERIELYEEIRRV